MVDKYDFYGVPPPSLNLEGRHKVTTILGLISTIFAGCCLSGFITVKFTQMMLGNKPSI